MTALTAPDIYAMTIDGLVEEFRKESLVTEASFRKLGKLFFLIETYGAKPYSLLLAKGVSKGTISNASYAIPRKEWTAGAGRGSVVSPTMAGREKPESKFQK